jgi:hypothetical protein
MFRKNCLRKIVFKEIFFHLKSILKIQKIQFKRAILANYLKAIDLFYLIIKKKEQKADLSVNFVLIK